MKDFILVINLIALSVYGYFLASKLDKFLGENGKTNKHQNNEHIKSYMVPKGNATSSITINEVNLDVK